MAKSLKFAIVVIVLALSLGSLSEMAQAQELAQSSAVTIQGPDYKDPGTATLLSVLCSGCGQIWAGETRKGAMLLATGLVAPAVGMGWTAASCNTTNGCNSTPMALGILAAVGAWGYGIFDASSSADRMNASRGLASIATQYIKVGIDSGGDTQIGLSIPVGR